MAKEIAFPLGRVALRHFHRDDWEMYEDFQFYWEERDMLVKVWKHMLTDHASTLSFLPDILIDNTGPISNGAVPHDMYYKLLAHSEGLPFRCIYDMLGGQYLTKKDTDRMFWAANEAVVDSEGNKEIPWHERKIAKLVILNLKAKWKWMSKEEWDQAVFTHIGTKIL